MSSRTQLIGWVLFVTLVTAIGAALIGVEAWAHTRGVPIDPNLHKYILGCAVLDAIAFHRQITAGAKSLLAVAAEAWKLRKGGGDA